MKAIVGNHQADEKELAELISRLRSVAKAMKGLSDDQADFQKKLQELKDEVNSVGFRLRRFS
jgi:septation ring formation regulator EzrA